LDPRQRLADGAELEAGGSVEGQGRTRLGEPVTLQEQDPRGVEELGDVTRQGRAPGDCPLEPPAERRVELRKNELVSELALQLEPGRDVLAALLVAADVAPDAHRPVEDLLLHGRSRLD